MTEDHTDGAYLLGVTVPQQINAGAGSTSTIANGPLVITGASLVNTGAAPATVTFTDGSGETVLNGVIAAGASAQLQVPDRGAIVTTQLNITVAGSGPVTGCAYTRQPRDYVRERESWRQKSEVMTSASPQGRP